MTEPTYRENTNLQDLGDGVTRRILSYGEDMMMVEVGFNTNSIGTMHTHVHTQQTYVLSGKFRFTADGKDYVVNQGDTIRFESNAPHGVVCLEAGVLLDIFTPMRKDFV